MTRALTKHSPGFHFLYVTVCVCVRDKLQHWLDYCIDSLI